MLGWLGDKYDEGKAWVFGGEISPSAEDVLKLGGGLKKGSRGDDVEELQKAILEAGKGLPEVEAMRNSKNPTDGKYGKLTRDAYKAVLKEGNLATWDKHTDSRIQGLRPETKKDVTSFINDVEKELGIKLRIPRVTGGFRTDEVQTELYSEGRDSKGNITRKSDVVTYAKAGYSYHNYGLAFDVVEIQDGETVWKTMATQKGKDIAGIADRYGLEWGGSWREEKRDYPHFQKTFGMSIKQVRELSQKTNSTSSPNYINIRK